MKKLLSLAAVAALFALLPEASAPAIARPAADDAQWITFDGGKGPGAGKHVVLISGDEEYRSEETLPQLAKILSTRHGFKCTVLFAIDKDGTINPTVTDNIPGLEALKTADLMVIFTRFRNLPDDQMKHVVDYIDSGKPIVGLRTATHAFNLAKDRKYVKYTWNNGSKDYSGGFGRQILGETWVAHHGNHGKEGTRGVVVKGQENNPILRGIGAGDVFGTTDVYTAKPPADSVIILDGEVTETLEPTSKAVAGKKNDPMMPIAWTRSYKSEGGTGKVFTTTMGASQDFAIEGTRRLIVNACYWAAGMEAKIPAKSDVAIVGDYQPLPFKFAGHKKGVKPADLLK